MNAVERRPRAARIKQDVSAAKDPDALLTIDTVSTLTGYSVRAVRKMVSDGRFPAPVIRGAKTARWVSRAVRQWLVEAGLTQLS